MLPPYTGIQPSLTIIVERSFFLNTAEWIGAASSIVPSLGKYKSLYIQLRNKTSEATSELCRAHDCLPIHRRLIFNATASLANRLQNRPIHFPESEINQDIDSKSFGFSIHNEASLFQAIGKGAKWLQVGPINRPISKQTGKIDPDKLNSILTHKSIPLLGVGGIQPNNIEKALHQGFSGVVAMGYIWLDKQPNNRIEELAEIVESYREL